MVPHGTLRFVLLGVAGALALWGAFVGLLWLDAASTEPEQAADGARGLAALLLPVSVLGGALAGILLSGYSAARAEREASASSASARTSDVASSTPSRRA